MLLFVAIVLIKFKMEITQPAEATIRAWRTILKNSWYALGDFWRSKYYPKHWLPNADKWYGYKARSKKWIDHKKYMAKFGRIPDEAIETENYFTGQLKADMDAMVVRPFPSRCSVYAVTPRYAPQRPRRADQPDKIGELFRLRDDENRRLANLWLKKTNEQIAALPPRKVEG